ncbi:MAG: hypothetical protein AABY93_07795 [Bacteroidota bacterium]|mgnify:CR=1 FL=1
MKLTSLRVLLFATLIAFGIWSCGSSSKEENNNSDDFNQPEESLKDQILELMDNLPSPTEIPYLLEATGAEYNQSLINDVKKVDQYTIRNDKAALNLGIYAADIGYLSSYEKTQESITYMAAVKSLADKLGVIGSFDLNEMERFESNISNKDSLTSILNTSVKKTKIYLQDDNRNKLAALMLTGSFIEGLYISTGLIKSYPKNLLPDDSRNLVLTPLMRIILEQEKSVDELVKMLQSVEQADPVTTIVADLTSLQASYRALEIEDQIKNNKASMVLTDKNLVDITVIVEKIRKSITD